MRFLNDLEAEKKDLIEQKKVIEKRLVNAPDGTLRIVKLRESILNIFTFGSVIEMKSLTVLT